MIRNLDYKGFSGIVEKSENGSTFQGKIGGTTDLIQFEADTPEELVKAFHEAVDDYIQLCKEVKKSPLGRGNRRKSKTDSTPQQ